MRTICNTFVVHGYKNVIFEEFPSHKFLASMVLRTIKGAVHRRRKYIYLNFKTLHRNSIFAIESQLSLAKWPP